MSKIEKFEKFHKQIEEGLSVKELMELRKKVYNVKVELYSEEWYEKHILLKCIKEFLDEEKEEVKRIKNESIFIKDKKIEKMYWKSDLPRLLNEVLNNKTCDILYQPINITKNILGELAQYAIKLNDTKLNCYMIMLGLYERSKETLDYLHKNYDIEKEN